MGAISIPAGSDPLDISRLHIARTTTRDTLSASNALIIAFILVVLAYALINLPWTFFRLQHAGWLTGWSLSSKPIPAPTRCPHPDYPNANMGPPQSIGHLPLGNPSYMIPRINLTASQFFVLLATTIVITVACFTNSNVITDSTRTGYIAITLLPCVIGLGNKVFGVGSIVQVGYASVNWLHRWLGRLLFVVSTLHTIAYMVIFAQTNSMKTEMSKASNILACISYAGLYLVFFASFRYVRQRWWHIFKVCHHFGILVFVVGLNYHSQLLRSWIGFSLAFLFFSLVLRALTSRVHIAYLTPLSSSRSTVVHLPSLRSGWIPGQHVRIRVLTGGMGLRATSEGHPFTLATAPTVDGVGGKLVVMAAGDWTAKLLQVAKKRSQADVEDGRGYPVAVIVEGPYGGCKLLYSAYSTVLLAGGGSGVSYILAVAQGIISDSKLGKSRTRELNIVWSVRDRAALNDIAPLFDDLHSSAPSLPHLKINITLHFTSVSRGFIVRPFSALPSSAVFVPARRQRKSYTPSPLSGVSPFSSANLLDSEKSSRVDLDDDSTVVGVGRDGAAGIGSPADEKIEDPFSDANAIESKPPAIELKPGRPVYATILKDIVEREQKRRGTFSERFSRVANGASCSGGGVAVGACGPAGMVLALKKLCADAEGVEFHEEIFSL
ncbi:hypothetical protein BS47DRAFT_1489162 [Hydnum rufescens UP504]|uniref:FAD-binding FR-type domain-containing protein n=1 Tax=Hydnum rufescens UP504 TaxID=1448309 RepID=A0A9P6AJA4_9AGAM|nr:hypothetical protein BS47DRAFT_1489162 [Hydnum rufescens UP504]